MCEPLCRNRSDVEREDSVLGASSHIMDRKKVIARFTKNKKDRPKPVLPVGSALLYFNKAFLPCRCAIHTPSLEFVSYHEPTSVEPSAEIASTPLKTVPLGMTAPFRTSAAFSQRMPVFWLQINGWLVHVNGFMLAPITTPAS